LIIAECDLISLAVMATVLLVGRSHLTKGKSYYGLEDTYGSDDQVSIGM
jgi:hypothetical protein